MATARHNERRTTRRAVLIAGAGGVAALAVDSVRRSPSADADNGDSMLLGMGNEETSPTEVVNSGIPGVAMRLRGNGVPGLESHSLEITGPLGSYADTGLHGVGSARGVMGEARHADASFSDGIGVQGHSGTGEGVRGGAADGVGVRGIASALDGFGVSAEHEVPGGVGLNVTGRALFSRSGTVTVTAGTASVVASGVEIRPETLILAVLLQNRPGVWIRAVVPHPPASTFTVWLNKPVASDTRLAWFAVN
ncbi:MAG: hypothetical protein ACJ77A_10320 [Actinomycetota bacterium]